MDKEFEDDFDDEEVETIKVTDEDGNEMEFFIIDALEDNDMTYLLVIESGDIDDEEAEATIIKEIEEDGEDFIYELVEDEAEFEKIAAMFENNSDEYDLDV